MNDKEFFNYLGYPFNNEPYNQVIFSLFFLIYISSDSISDILRQIILVGNGIYFIFILKECIKSPRPVECYTTNIKYCPKSYDIPSGHSFLAVYWLLILLKKNKPYTLPLIFYLGTVPFSRYFLKVHTIKAVVSGSSLGFLWFIIYNVLTQ